MPPQTAARGLRRVELVTPSPGDAAVFLQRLLGWLALYAQSGFDCWVGERKCASIRAAKSSETVGWHLVFAGGAHDSSLTGPDDANALLRKGRAQHGPWAPGPRLGEPTWVELRTAHPQRADTFWADTLCWTAPSDSEEPAIYAADGRPVATRVTRCDADQRHGWLCYFAVDDVDAAGERVRELGGQVLEPIRHPVLGATLLVADPHGAVLALSRLTHTWGAANHLTSRAESSSST